MTGSGPSVDAGVDQSVAHRWPSVLYDALARAAPEAPHLIHTAAGRFGTVPPATGVDLIGLATTFETDILPALRTALAGLTNPLDTASSAMRDAGSAVGFTKKSLQAMAPAVENVYTSRRIAVAAVEGAAQAWMSSVLPLIDADPVAGFPWADPAADYLPTPAVLPPEGNGTPTPPDPAAAFASIETGLGAAAARLEQEPFPPLPSDPDIDWSLDPDSTRTIEDHWREVREEDQRFITEARNRLLLIARVMTFRTEVHACAAQVVADAWEAAPATLRSGSATVRDALARAHHAIRDGSDHRVDRLRRTRKRLATTLEQTLNQMASTIASVDLAPLTGRRAWGRLQETIATLPEDLVVHATKDDGGVGRSLILDLQEVARDAFVPPWPDQLRTAGTNVRNRLMKIGTELDQVLDIVEYNLDDAIAQLEEPDPDVDPGPEREDPALTAIRRAGERLNDIEITLAPEWLALGAAVRAAVADDWGALHRRVVVRDQVSERFVGVSTRVVRFVEQVALRSSEIAKRGWAHTVRIATRWGRWTRRLIARGQAAVGVVDQDGPDPATCLAPLDRLETARAELPRVYRRLFTLDALTEPTLVQDRSRDLVLAKRIIGTPPAGGRPLPLVIVAAPETGRTTMLNLIADRLLTDVEIHRVSLINRPADANALVEEIERQSGWRPGPAGHACLIDGAEQLVQVAFGGTDMTRAHLDLFATFPSTQWILTMTSGAWHFLARAWPDIARRVAPLALTPFDADGLERVVMERHDRSGLPVVFQPSDRLPTLTRRRLRRARDDEHRQLVLREYFFDALGGAAYHSPRLALVHWLLTTSLDEEHVTVGAVSPLDLSFLNHAELDLVFALRAFWIHGTLDAPELMQCLRTTARAADAAVGHLGGLQLVHEVSDCPGRFRLRRFLAGPVAGHLRRRNLIPA